MSSRELSEWMAYYNLEPWGEAEMDLRFGVLCALTANIHRAPGRPAADPRTFMPSEWRQKAAERQDWRVMKALLIGSIRVHNQRIEKEQRKQSAR